MDNPTNERVATTRKSGNIRKETFIVFMLAAIIASGVLLFNYFNSEEEDELPGTLFMWNIPEADTEADLGKSLYLMKEVKKDDPTWIEISAVPLMEDDSWSADRITFKFAKSGDKIDLAFKTEEVMLYVSSPTGEQLFTPIGKEGSKVILEYVQKIHGQPPEERDRLRTEMREKLEEAIANSLKPKVEAHNTRPGPGRVVSFIKYAI